MKKLLFSLTLLFVVSIFQSCGSEPKPQEPPKTSSEKIADEVNKSIDEAFEGIEGGSEDLKKSIKDMVSGVGESVNNDVEIVSFRDMKALFPDKVAGLSKIDKGEGSNNEVMGMKISTYEVDYGDRKNKVSIQMMDTGGLGMALMGAVPWSKVKIDKETKDGYEMTTEYKGHKAFEKYNEGNQQGSLALLVGDRFVLNIEGRGVSMETLKEARADIDIENLLRLAE